MQNRDANEMRDRTLVSLRCTGRETLHEREWGMNRRRTLPRRPDRDELDGVRTLGACALEDFFDFVRDVDPGSLGATRDPGD
jgi:hypothetical protein